MDYRATMIGYKTEEPIRRYDGIYVLISDVVQTSDTNQTYHIIQEQGYEQVYFPEEVKNAA